MSSIAKTPTDNLKGLEVAVSRHYEQYADRLDEKRRSQIVSQDLRSLSWGQTDEFRVIDYKPFQMLDGEGIRCSLYVSYCPFVCSGCYNKKAQKKTAGEIPVTEELFGEVLADLANPRVAGLSLVGGEPMLSAKHLLPLALRVREQYPEKTIWLYTGYLTEVLLCCDDERRQLFELCDVVVDGQYVKELRDNRGETPFRGSVNQRLVDVSQTLVTGQVVEYVPGA